MSKADIEAEKELIKEIQRKQRQDGEHPSVYADQTVIRKVPYVNDLGMITKSMY